MNLLLVCLINLLLTSTIYGIKPVVSLYASSLGITPSEISIIVASYALFSAFLAVKIGQWIDQFGIRKMVLFGNIILLIALLIGMVYPGFILLILMQTLLGIAYTWMVIALQKSLSNLGGNVDQSVAQFTIYASIGQMAGPVIGLYVFEHWGFTWNGIVNMIMMTAAFLLCFLVKKDSLVLNNKSKESGRATSERKESVWLLMRERNLRNAVTIGGLILSTRELFLAYFPLLAAMLGFSPTMIGWMLAMNGITMLLVRFSQPSLVRRFGRLQALAWSLIFSGIIYVITPFSVWIVATFILVAVLGATVGLGQPLSMAHVIEVSPPERKGEVLGLRITVNRLSQLIVPLIFGGLGGLAGVASVFWASGAVLSIFGYLTKPEGNKTTDIE